ncbi:MAG: hypothetical protein ABIB98_02440 [bacterium]
MEGNVSSEVSPTIESGGNEAATKASDRFLGKITSGLASWPGIIGILTAPSVLLVANKDKIAALPHPEFLTNLANSPAVTNAALGGILLGSLAVAGTAVYLATRK